MKLFLDASVLLAACGSDRGASREIFRRAAESEWKLLTSTYVIQEVEANLADLPSTAAGDWSGLKPALEWVPDVLTLDRPVVFAPAKDRPVLFTALAWSETLLTLDRLDFGALFGTTFYGLLIVTPGMFLERERAAGRLK
jgi:hypothetical protein